MILKLDLTKKKYFQKLFDLIDKRNYSLIFSYVNKQLDGKILLY